MLILSWALGKFIKTLLRKGFMMVTMLYCAQTLPIPPSSGLRLGATLSLGVRLSKGCPYHVQVLATMLVTLYCLSPIAWEPQP